MEKFSELLDEYLDLRENPHVDSDWKSIDANYAARENHEARKQELLAAMDEMIGDRHD